VGGTSVGAFIDRFIAAIEAEKLSGEHDVFKPISFSPDLLWELLTAKFVFGLILLFLAGFLLAIPKRDARWQIKYAVLLFSITTFGLFLRFFPYRVLYNYLCGYYVFAPFLGTIVRDLIRPGRATSPTFNDTPLVILLAILTVIYGLGSNNDIIMTTSTSSFFILIALIFILGRVSDPQDYGFKLVSLCGLTVIISIGLVVISWSTPYRQPPDLWSYSSQASIRKVGASLNFHPVIAGFLSDIHSQASNAGLQHGTPMIDLTGRAPGIIYALGGYTPGAFWLNSSNLNAKNYALHMIGKISCANMARSWIVWEKRPPYSGLDPEILKPSGISFPSDFQFVATALYASDFRLTDYNLRPIYLFKPNREPAKAYSACLDARKNF
jgi:hypothetical protein